MIQKDSSREVFLSVVVPAFNEEKRIKGTLDRIIRYLATKDFRSEIIVVDDGSRDGTIAAVKSVEEANDFPVLILRNNRNMGKGYTVKKGVLGSVGRYILFSDADMSTPIDEFDKMQPLLEENYDVVIGSRALMDSDIKKRQAWYRERMGKMFNFLVRILVFKGIKDTQCGFKAFKGEVARRIFSKITINRFGFDVELLYLARKLDLRIIEVPIVWINSPASRVRCVSDSLFMFMSLIKIRLNDLLGKYKII